MGRTEIDGSQILDHTITDYDIAENAAIVATKIAAGGSSPTRQDFSCSVGQTTFVVTQSFTSGQEWIYYNGSLLTPTTVRIF